MSEDFDMLYKVHRDQARHMNPDSLDKSLFAALMWSVEQFPEENQEACVEHLRREAEELVKNPTSAEEMADIAMLLNRAAYNADVNLAAAVWAKRIINEARQWGPPDEAGVSEHVR